jgi:hypothetical protein
VKQVRCQFPHDHIRTGAEESTRVVTPVEMSGSAGCGVVTSGRLQIVGSAANVTLQVAAQLAGLFRAEFSGPSPGVWVDGGVVTLTYPRGLDPAIWPQAEAAITVNGALPWEIEFESISNLNAPLSGLQLRALDVTENLSRGQVTLPFPTGIVYIRIAGNVTHLRLQRPVGVAVQVVVRQAATALTFDDQYVEVVSGGLSLETDDYQQAGNRCDIEVAGSASDLTITAETSERED